MSPSGGSSLTTSAPRSDIMRPANGPDTTRDRSRTRMPKSGPEWAGAPAARSAILLDDPPALGGEPGSGHVGRREVRHLDAIVSRLGHRNLVRVAARAVAQWARRAEGGAGQGPPPLVDDDHRRSGGDPRRGGGAPAVTISGRQHRAVDHVDA